MREIGGYFELELEKRKEYHPEALRLNSGRNALYYILKVLEPAKIFIPYYICDSVLEPIHKLKIELEFYHINKKFEPEIPTNFNQNDFVLSVNYFGINDSIVKFLAATIKNLIIDNSQAFYCQPYKYPTFYSTRKFFGVVDGGYLYIEKFLEEELEQAISYKNYSHILKRWELGADAGYEDYLKVEEFLSHDPIKRMSNLTQNILSSINYKKVKLTRERNFIFLHKNLKDLNELPINLENLNGPMKYPFLINNRKLKQFLIDNKIYISTYWQEVIDRVEKSSFEYYLTENLIPIPIDQRYNLSDMKLIIEKIKEVI
ncbi:MAG: hypothetical protein ACFFBT_10940 [Promethearchaeota archaeon]